MDTLPSPGAEDNASGCSGVLEMATILSQYETERSILFICFNAEERGSLGSGDVISVLSDQGDADKIQGMLNMDMIAYRSSGNNTAVVGSDNLEYGNFTNSLAVNGQLYSDLDWAVSMELCCTDFESFTKVNIPAIISSQIDISTYPHYHKFTDVPQHLDPSMAEGIIHANLATLADLVAVNFQINQYEVTPAHSGMWYNAEQSGHGLSVEVLDNNLMLVVWYVFDDEGNQIWLVGVGT